MSRIAIPSHLVVNLGAEMKMDTHWIDVRLRDGQFFGNLVVQGSRFITGRALDRNGEGTLPFGADDIVNIRRRSLLGAVWPFWPSRRTD